ncbi:MAG TPA: VWA domain-containing protein [Pyrinomonadaceae bacterium]|nr:VWA domain-containing protein [Pyrinomonadaceae bacterium]
MRKVVALVLLVGLCAVPSANLFGQGRQRRVGQQPPATTPAPRPLPQSVPARPTTQTPQGGSVGARAPQEVGEEEVGEDEVVRVNTALVTIPVSIMDRDGRFISGLRKEEFRIFEDGVEQQVAYFATVQVPFTVALVIDTSGSTRFKLDDIQNAAIAFLDQLGPNDKVLVLSFDDDVRVHAEATNDRRVLRNAIRQTRPGNGTRLYDAVDFVIKRRFDRVQGRKAIVLFTDGVDTSSKHASMRDNLADAEELDAIVYPIQYDTTNGASGGGGGWGGGGNRRRGSVLGDILENIIIGGGNRRWPRGGGGGGGGGGNTTREEYERAGDYLRQMATLTGGRHHDAEDLGRVEYAFTNIAEELRRQYSLGYYPARQSNASERRQIKVRVRRPNLVVRARDSYVYRPSGAHDSTTTAQDAGQQQRQPPELRRRQLDDARGGLGGLLKD